MLWACFQKRSLLITRLDQVFLTNSPFLDPIGFSEWYCFHPAHYIDRCWIRNVITTIGYSISNTAILTIPKLPRNIHLNMFRLYVTVNQTSIRFHILSPVKLTWDIMAARMGYSQSTNSQRHVSNHLKWCYMVPFYITSQQRHNIADGSLKKIYTDQMMPLTWFQARHVWRHWLGTI